MADEDALFAEFMGEIKSTVVVAEADDGAASDTASVGDVNADNDEGAGRNGADTNKRKGEVCYGMVLGVGRCFSCLPSF